MEAALVSMPVHTNFEASVPDHILVRKDSRTELRAAVTEQDTRTHFIICDGVDCCCGAPCPHCCPAAVLENPPSDWLAPHFVYDIPDTPAPAAFIHSKLRRPPRTFA